MGLQIRYRISPQSCSEIGDKEISEFKPVE